MTAPAWNVMLVAARTPDVTLRCPQCGRERVCYRHRSDPKRTAVVEGACPDCAATYAGEVRYFDADGHELVPRRQRARGQLSLFEVAA